MKHFHRSFRPALALTAALVAGACGDSTGLDDLNDEMVLDAAMLAADATIEEVTMWTESFGFGSAPAAADGMDPAAVGRPGGRGPWNGEFSGTRSVTFFDAEGVEQDAYDALLTASIEFLREIEGAVSRGPFEATISRAREMTVSGLEGEETERTWNGEGTSEVSRSGVLDDGSERTHSVSGSFTFEDVVVPIPGDGPRYPLSGTITRNLTVTRTTPDGTETREVTVVITFDGSETATAVVNGEVMEIDLSARDGRRPLRRGRS